jgi:hypothetical protein
MGGDHGAFALGAGAVLDTTKDSPLALAEFVEDISFHSKVSVVWPSEDMRPPPLLPNHRGFSSFFRQMDLRDPYITLDSGLGMMTQPPIPEPLWNTIPAEAQIAIMAVLDSVHRRVAELEQRIRDLEARLKLNSTNSS